MRNVLPSPANEIDIEILLPFRVMNAQGISKQFLTPENTSVEVWLPLIYFRFLSVLISSIIIFPGYSEERAKQHQMQFKL